MSRTRWLFSAVVLLMAMASCVNAPPAQLVGAWHIASPVPSIPIDNPGVSHIESAQENADTQFTNLPLYFIENRGQVESRVAFYVQGSRNSVYFTARGITFALTGTEGPEIAERASSGARQRWAVKLDFVDANPSAVPVGQEPAEARVSYFKGKQAEWETGIPTYGEVVYRDLWPGIDLVYTGTAGRLKYTFVVRPGADPNRIQLAYRGATDVRVTEEGRLAVTTPVGGFEDDSPYVYQEVGGQQIEVPSAYSIDPDGTSDADRYGFRLGNYDKSKPLILDPAILYYSGYLSGNAGERGDGIAVDSAGNAYVTGYSQGGAGFPVTVGPDLTNNGGSDVFVAKINRDGTALIYCGYIGGAGTDAGRGIAIDASGNAYVVGTTGSSDFPATVGPDLGYNGGLYDTFVAKVNSSGTGLDYAGYVGGSGNDDGEDIAVDGSGNAYITGYTTSTELTATPFPLVGGPDLTFNGGSYDGFVTKVNSTGSALVYSGFIGGSDIDYGRSIAVDGTGAVYIAGTTASTEAGVPSFPLAVGPDLTYNGGTVDAFVAKLDASGTTFIYSGYIGGVNQDRAWGIDIDGSGNAYIAGETASDETTFPETVGPDLTYNTGTSDIFVAKLNATGSTFAYCGYIGGTSHETAYDIAVDNTGSAYVVGTTQTAADWGFPTVNGPDSTVNGGDDAIIAKINPAGTALEYSGYIGGSVTEIAYGVDVDPYGNAYVIGLTSSTDFRVWNGPELTYDAGNEAWVARVSTIPNVLALIGIETGDLSELASPVGGAADLIAVRPGSGNFSLRQAAGTSVVADGLPQLTTLGLRFSFYKTFNPVPVPNTIVEFTNGVVTTGLWALQVMTDGRLMIQDVAPGSLGLQGTLTGTTPLANGTWYTIRIAYDAAAGGIIKVWVDGSLDIDASHTNAGTAVEAFEVSDTGNACQFDDFYLIDVARQPPLGQIVRLAPNGAGGLSQFDTSAGFSNVAELIPDDDTTSNIHADNNTTATDLYALENPPAEWINAVKAMWRMRRGTGSGGGTHDTAWSIDGVASSAAFPALDADTNWHSTDVIWSAPPEGNGWWTAARVDGLELGAKHNGAFGRDTYLTWTTAMVDYDVTTTAVTLVSFTGSGYDGAALLEWETGSEMDNLGFHLYRAVAEEGPYQRITSALIPGLGSSPEGARYRYEDRDVVNGVTYYYKVEDIETTGRSELHGPVSATPQAGLSEGLREKPGLSGAGMVYGDPAANGLHVVSRDEGSVVLELRTEGFFAELQPDGTVHIEVPGFEVADDAPVWIPVRRAWVEAMADRGVALTSVRGSGEERFEGLRPSTAGQPQLQASERGTVRAVRMRRVRRGLTEGVYPDEAARLLEVGFQEEAKKALLELAPVRWDGNGLVLSRRLEVRLSFAGRESAQGQDGHRYRLRRSHVTRRVGARLVTKDRGLYAIPLGEVLGGARRNIDSHQLRLSRQGEAVPFHLDASTLYFVSEGASINPYGHEAVYELEVGVSGSHMETSEAPAWGASATYFWQREEREENRYYQAVLLDAPDQWLWDLLMAPEVKAYPIEVRGLASAPEPSRLEVWLQGVSDFPAEPDHHVRVHVNGVVFAEASWDGKQAQRIEVELPTGVLREGSNLLELENVGDTPARYSMVMLDRYIVEYPRVIETELEGRFSQTGVVELEAAGYVVDVTDNLPVWLGSRLRFRAEAGRSYRVVAPEALLQPEVRPVVVSRLKSSTNQGDYVVVGPAALLTAAEPLFELRRSQGLRVMAVPIEEVYSEFGYGEETPEAVRDFLSYAYHRWRGPAPRYVLLLGDGTYDFKDYLATGVVNQVPPLLVRTRYMWTASDLAYASVNGEDGLPDMAIGRLPASSTEEVQAMVDKIVSFETGLAEPQRPVVLVADNPDSAGEFDTNAEELATFVGSTRPVRTIHLSQLGAPATRQAILDAFDEGTSVVSYIGHGGIHLWADENIFNTSQVELLSPRREQPLVLTMNCLNGYFHFPYFDALSEALVKAEGRGAVAAFSPSGMSLNAPAQVFHEALLRELLEGGHQRLGDALLAAQAAYAETGVFPELLRIYHLIGDPTLRLR